ncbi:MAG: signal peptide peptidase SppA, partial [Bacteroidales bacterium]|nr:signal peptide peptidase SppA [Bacteroidales bacterium]
NNAATDNTVKSIYLRPDGVTSGIAQLEEIRKALTKFRESGKPVIAYTEAPSNGSMYLATAADKIYMSSNRGGLNTFVGISSRMIFLKDLLDRLGVNFQLIRHGKFKSAGEMYIRSEASAENLHQNQVLVNTIWREFSSAIADSRDIETRELNALIDNLSLNFPEDFKQAGLVDETFDHAALVEKMCLINGVPSEKDLHLIRNSDYIEARIASAVSYKGDRVAIIFADGEIVDDKSDYDNVDGDRFAAIINDIREDKDIKSVVLRVNSPGGSVNAATKIKNALDRLAEEKPVVASFGNYAASGGYWISAGAARIYSDATTLTGSIGVFSMIPEFSKTAKNLLHVNVTSVKSNRHSDMFSLMRPFDSAETAYMQSSVEDIYSQFVALVAQGRGIAPHEVDEIAQGRVWAGSDAIDIHLVDEIGTLEDAIAYAAGLAGLEEDGYSIATYPRPLTTMESFMYSLGSKKNEPVILSGTPFEGIAKALLNMKAHDPSKAYALMDYSLDIR